MLTTAIHLAAYAFIQTAAFALFALSLRRLQKIKSLRIIKPFLFILTVNVAGALTFGETAWQKTTSPLAAGAFVAGMAFFAAAHVYLLTKH